MLILNLDGFKVFNDTMGTAAGDQVLQEIARRLESCCRVADTPGQTSVKMPHAPFAEFIAPPIVQFGPIRDMNVRGMNNDPYWDVEAMSRPSTSTDDSRQFGWEACGHGHEAFD